jgi:glutathione S-transferase
LPRPATPPKQQHALFALELSMTAPYRLYGADLSPYSVKALWVMRFKEIPHEWIERSLSRQAEFQKYAKLPLIPVMVGADDYAMQDSTPIVEKLELRYPEKSFALPDPALNCISFLLEDFSDEWLNKAMFHYRWTYPADQESAAKRIVAMMFAGQPDDDRSAIEAQVRERMTGRLHHVGSDASTGPVIEASFKGLLQLLEAHLSDRPYLFGARPALGDFGIACQLYQLLSDPTPGAIIRAEAPRVEAWVARMQTPSIEGDFETLASLSPTLKPILSGQVARYYLPWMAANAQGAREGAAVAVTLDGVEFTQNAQKYAAKAFTDVRRRRGALSGNADLAALLEETGCDVWLRQAPQTQENEADEGEGEGETPSENGANEHQDAAEG